ncbi:hypothetical protein TPHA_0K00850 [Tetrapisispora phaffii CBS 4417]|uniref:Protein-lysine N-methyltransferase EFM4 n=1 Tax=Tetrapisispora phaffii (strain ATCC 24235 / CBS 4417 / NBRC 1672 / NRRL Y-8282 / UCD 70-5) TaxID=1071381 RepID=G8BZ91_TETPH|nr:hypothetical protein TPHA_0K00850 [Tetrapisispora phaffii CBS 4417]CCE65219.1 hypothetical protein TPHA_0K00850 [Tetrapisispora phaffii CBS 4417]
MEDTTELNTSKLGTKKYWDNFYDLERKNFKENSEDTGECWFDDNDAELNMIEFLEDNLGQYNIRSDSSIMDLGTGNGHLLFELWESESFCESKNILGVDYSEESVIFATEIAKHKDLNNKIKFQQADIFQEDWNPGKFDVVLDKGTLDAIALSGIKVGDGKSTIVEKYSGVIEKLLQVNGVFLITSCNFTQEELIKIIETDSLKMFDNVRYPSFEFGGIKGSTICTIAFVKTK